MHRRSLLASVTIASVALLTAPSGVAAASPNQSHHSCTGIVQITRFAFNPSSVSPGDSSTANLSARNCTSASQQTTATWFGRFIGASTGIPTGCPVLDPLPQPATFAPYGTFHSSVGYLVPASCTASQLQITVQIQQSGTVLAQQSTNLAITQ
ncbi:MAG TPA: hypothetical protein VGN81_16525 [Pseudonocardiaceae bacterium]